MYNKKSNKNAKNKSNIKSKKSNNKKNLNKEVRKQFKKSIEEQIDNFFIDNELTTNEEVSSTSNINYKFEDFNLCEKTLKALKDAGYITPTEIQAKTIPLILEGKDVIGQSKTGTGKTASYSLPTIEKINSLDKNTQILVLCPTRELAVQVADEIRKFMKYQEGIKTIAIYGGQSIENQIRTLKRGVQIVIGTPGRIIDHMKRKTLKLNTVHTVILDEADEMLNMGFEEDIEKILGSVPEERQTILFSATMNQRILNIANKYLKEPVNVKIKAKELTVNNIEQIAIPLKESMKTETLIRLLKIHKPKKAIIFCNTKKRVDKLINELSTKGYNAEGLHSDIKQSQRDKIMKRIKNNDFTLLVATDVVARGIDIQDIELVINYDIPQENEYYVHRIGRTGRNGSLGKAFTFVVGKEKRKLDEIRQYAHANIITGIVPTINDIIESNKNKIIDQIQTIIDKNIFINENLLKTLIKNNSNNVELVAKALITLLCENKGISDMDNLNKTTNSTKFSKNEMIKLFFNVGKKDSIKSKDFVGLLSANCGITSEELGKINILDSFSFVEVPGRYIDDILIILKDKKIKNKDFIVEIANS